MCQKWKKEYSLLTREIVQVQKLLIQKVKIEEKHSWEWKSLFGDGDASIAKPTESS